MTLRKKILTVMGAAFLCALGLTYGLSQKIVLGSFARLEIQNVHANVQRVLDALEEEPSDLESRRDDWVEWYSNAEGLKALREKTQLEVEFLRSDASETPQDYREARARISKESPVVVRVLDENRVAGYAEIPDSDGSPRLTLKVAMDRDIFKHGKNTAWYFMIALLPIGTLLLFVLVFALQYLVLGPISILSNHAAAIGKGDDPSSRLSMKRSDEIGTLAREFDGMAQELEDSKKRLLNQTHALVTAEKASGVLRDVRNSMVSVLGRLEALRKHLGDMPMDEMAMAREELYDKKLSEERKHDLYRFLHLANKSVSKHIKAALSEETKIAEEMAKIENILSEANESSQAEPSSEESASPGAATGRPGSRGRRGARESDA